jgi:peptide deformylase
MTTLKIVTYPDQLLSRPSKPVDNIDQSIQDLIEKMAVTMYEAPGVGLAAIQVGIDKSIVVYDESPMDGKRDFNVLINPKIIRREGEILTEDEGCLSVPDFTASVRRSARVTVEALDREGKPLTIDAEDILAIILQHEIDHLNGILFVDRLSALKRELFKRRVRKQLKRRGVA